MNENSKTLIFEAMHIKNESDYQSFLKKIETMPISDNAYYKLRTLAIESLYNA